MYGHTFVKRVFRPDFLTGPTACVEDQEKKRRPGCRSRQGTYRILAHPLYFLLFFPTFILYHFDLLLLLLLLLNITPTFLVVLPAVPQLTRIPMVRGGSLTFSTQKKKLGNIVRLMKNPINRQPKAKTQRKNALNILKIEKNENFVLSRSW